MEQQKDYKAINSRVSDQIYAFLSLIKYFDFVQLHVLGNEILKEIILKDLEELDKAKAKKEAYRADYPIYSVSEIPVGRSHEAKLEDLRMLFEKKFEYAKALNGFKTRKAFASHEFKYQKSIWKLDKLTEWFPIAKQWLDFLKNYEEKKPKEVPRFKDHYMNENGRANLEDLKSYIGSLSDPKPKKIAAIMYFMKDKGYLSNNADFSEYKVEFHNSFMNEFGLEKRRDSMNTPFNNFRREKGSSNDTDSNHYNKNIDEIEEALKSIKE